MVLSASTSDHRAGAPGEWLRHLARVLHLGRDKVIVLVTGAVPARLRELVQRLLDVDSGARVYASAGELAGAPEGALALLAARAEDAAWLNVQRPIFAERRMRLVVWADDAVALALAERAPDFFDWISHVVACPSQPSDRVPGFAVACLRSAPGYPGVVWTGGDLDTALAVAFPGSEVVRASAMRPYAELVAAARDAGERWLVWTDVQEPRDIVRIRWALAEADRRERTVLERPACDAPGWWPAAGECMDVHEAAARLGGGADGDAALMAALLDLEPGAVALAALLDLAPEAVERAVGQPVEDGAALQVKDAAALIAKVRHATDPGAELAREALARGLVESSDVVSALVGSDAMSELADMDSVTPNSVDTGAPELPNGRFRAPLLRGLYRQPVVEAWVQENCASTASWLAALSNRTAPPETKSPDVPEMILWANSCPDAPPLPEGWLPWGSYWVEALLRPDVEPATWLRLIEWASDYGYLDAAALWLREQIPENLKQTAQRLTKPGRLLKTAKLHRRAAEVIEHSLGREHPAYARSLEMLAEVLEQQNAYEEAERLMRQALELRKKVLGSHHPDYLRSLRKQVFLLLQQGRPGEAELLLRDSLDPIEAHLGAEHPAYVEVLGLLALALMPQGRYQEAEELSRQAWELTERTRGPEHPDLAALSGNLAVLCLATGRAAEAAEHAAHAYALAMRSLGPEHPQTKSLEGLRQHIAQLLAPPNSSPAPVT